MKKSIIYKFLPFLILFIFISGCSPVMAWTVSPVRFEIEGEKGKEYTFTFAVLNESQLHQKRFEINVDDWIIDKNNNFLRKAFNPGVTNKYSASQWIKVTPQQFAVGPGETKNIRFTVSVPENIPLNGEYSTGLFVGEKNIEKPIKGEKIVHIKQDTYIGVVVYVKFGQGKQDVVLKDLKIDTKPLENGFNKVIVTPAYESRGNIHSRAEIFVKAEPVGQFETGNIKAEPTELIPGDRSSQIKKFPGGELVVLRESELMYPVELPEPFKSGSEWKFTVSADFGKNSPVLVGTKKFRIPVAKIENKTQDTQSQKTKK